MTGAARLLSVRLQGFKSFADRTHVEFGPGISAVVGPNGSGKSNLADALRWALGEQGRALRSRKAEDVIWAGSERRPAVGMADVQLTLDNGDGLLPVEYGAVELGRRLYRSGENDYLLNRQRVRLKDLVDLLDAGHLAENAFLFIGQGMVDQALALRPEERRPLFEEVAGVRRHERRRRRAEDQLGESEANLARVHDILAELRPQARRLAQQAEQQANRRSAADELAAALILSAHARWHVAAAREAAAAATSRDARTALDEATAELVALEESIAVAGAALDGHAADEAAARAAVDRARADRAALQLREGRRASDVDATGRERRRLEETRAAAEADLAAARAILAEPRPATPAGLEAELAAVDSELAALAAERGAGRAVGPRTTDGVSAADAEAIRRLEAARAEERATAARRATEAERHTAEERERADRAAAAATQAATERDAAAASLSAAVAAEATVRTDREAAVGAVAEREASARAADDAVAGSRAGLAALGARLADARRALESAEGTAFSRAARARGGRSIADGLIVDPALKAAVDAALAGLARALVLSRDDIAAVATERGVALSAEALRRAAPGRADASDARRVIELARARGGGYLVDAVRRDDPGGATALLSRVVWLPDAADCLALQDDLPAGWVAVARDGRVVVGEVITWAQPDGRGLQLRPDVDRLAAEHETGAARLAALVETRDAAQAALAEARATLASARERESAAGVERRRLEELDRAAAARAEAARRDAAWLEAQVSRLAAEAGRLRAAVPDEPASTDGDGRSGAADRHGPATATADAAAEAARASRLERLTAQRAELVADLDVAAAARGESERRRAGADAQVALAERQLIMVERGLADLAEREARLAAERDDLVSALAEADQALAAAEAALAAVVAATTTDRERLRAAESAASSVRERARLASERLRQAERDDVEARLGLEALREQLLVELAGLGSTALAHLGGGSEAGSDDVEPEQLESALVAAAAAWAANPPVAEPPPPGRLATLRRRFHDLGAVNPFAADEHAEVQSRLDGLEAQRTDLESAIDHTRALIRELDQLVSDQFRRTFAALERAFDARFQQLFGGGFARLALTDPDDLTSTGIEITARPPGKKPQALAMLSGGERALTAVALLFAMLEVRPVPFCVLDEVDAALDEANIGRFTDALRELARTTQCIVITHNRGTIEAADALYGVTVGDDSVSRVISLRLDEATALAGRGRRAELGAAGAPPDDAASVALGRPAGDS